MTRWHLFYLVFEVFDIQATTEIECYYTLQLLLFLNRVVLKSC